MQGGVRFKCEHTGQLSSVRFYFQFETGYGGGDVVAPQPAGEDYWIRDRRRREWERLHPGIPFEGAEAVVGAWD